MNWEGALQLAAEEAELYRGATSPNPPVGAVALSEDGQILAVAAHRRAGEFHAERRLLEELRRLGGQDQLHTVVVTLEPCSHQGRTPPCTDALFSAGVSRVVFGLRDLHPEARGGEQVLREAGIEVICLSDFAPSASLEAVASQLGPFFKVTQTGMPWITVKQALNESGSMLPPQGQKTFTSESSLKMAHLLRRRADAILTGSGTILADQPEFTVRHLPDHAQKMRHLIIADRRQRVSSQCPEYLSQATGRGFNVVVTADWRRTLRELAVQGVLEVLLEAGPTLTEEVLQGEFDEQWVIQKTSSGEDTVQRKVLRKTL